MGGTVLLVAKETTGSDSPVAALTCLGYKVRTAPNGERAIALCLAYPDIAALVFDLRLTEGLDGVTTAMAVHLLRKLPVVLLPTDEKDIRTCKAALMQQAECLPLNWDNAGLGAAVERALNPAPAASSTPARRDLAGSLAALAL